jgi:hypothetical protein
LVGGTLRLRLTAHAVVGLPRNEVTEIAESSRSVLSSRTGTLDAWYERLAAQVDRPRGRAIETLEPPDLEGAGGAPSSPHAVWLCEHLNHLTDHLAELIAPATRVAEIRRRPWWR